MRVGRYEVDIFSDGTFKLDGGQMFGVVPKVFWEKVNQAQLEKYGRILSPNEIVEALKDEQHFLTKLSRERLGWKNKK